MLLRRRVHRHRLWEFDNNKARRGWAMLDVVSLMQQLGLA